MTDTTKFTPIQWLAHYDAGLFAVPEEHKNTADLCIARAILAGFWDWFCQHTDLPGQIDRVAEVLRLLQHSKIDPGWLVAIKNCDGGGSAEQEVFQNGTYNAIQFYLADNSDLAMVISHTADGWSLYIKNPTGDYPLCGRDNISQEECLALLDETLA